MERRLAAILAADVAGYSRLMGADGADTPALLKSHLKETIDPKIAAHHGRIVKLMGDGLLAEFGSVVDAVECGVAIQRAMARLREFQPNVSIAWVERYVPYTKRAMPHFLDGMRKAGLE